MIKTSPQSAFASVYFHHIGKTGGTSLDAILASRFRARDCYPGHTLTRALLTRPFRYVSGHMPWQTREILPHPNLTITTVRDPVAHFLSTFRHLRRQPEHIFTLTATQLQPNFSIDDFLNDAGVRRYLVNPQTLSIGRQLSWKQYLDFCNRIERTEFRLKASRTDPLFVSLYGDPDEDRADPELLRRACERLDKATTLVFPTEELDAHLNLICMAATGRPHTEPIERKNVALPDDLEISKAQHATIVEMTKLDAALYEFAKRQA